MLQRVIDRRTSRRLFVASLVGVVLAAGWPLRGTAQEAAEKDSRDPRSPLAGLPQKGRSDEEVKSFIDSLSQRDRMLDVVVGQGRLITLKEDLAVSGKPEPLVAVGDPKVLDFEIIGPRHIRITGRKVGVTDLSIVTADRQNYTMEVWVVVDLDVLRAQLKQSFPQATLRLAHLRDHVVVEGQAPDRKTRDKIIETINAYLFSVHASQLGKIKSEKDTDPFSRDRRPGTIPVNVPDDPDAEPDGNASPDGSKPTIEDKVPGPQVINLIQLEGPEAEADPLVELSVRLRGVFPGAQVQLSWLNGIVVIEGQARDARQVEQIERAIVQSLTGLRGGAEGDEEPPPPPGAPAGANSNLNLGPAVPPPPPAPRVINLLRVPGPQQVMLKVQIAELNRTALRRIGFSFLFQDTDTVVGAAAEFARLLTPFSPTTGTTAFAILDGGDANIFIQALRRNRVFKLLAEPNLVAMNGQEATFLAGGEFPVPVPQSGAGIGGVPTVTIQYKEFGVRLLFKPIIHDDNTIRLAVAPEVSSIDFDLGILVSGTRVPALNTRRASTVVELREGQTLAMAGLMQLELAGSTERIPGLGDLPYIGPFFSNTSSEKIEKELVVLVTPYLVDAMPADHVPPLPGAEVKEPTDFEMYLLIRIESRNCVPFRSTTAWDDPLHHHERQIHIEQSYMIGPYGYSQ